MFVLIEVARARIGTAFMANFFRETRYDSMLDERTELLS